MTNLTNEQLLENAEKAYQASKDARSFEIQHRLLHAQRSAAASLLVIARNSMPITVIDPEYVSDKDSE